MLVLKRYKKETTVLYLPDGRTITVTNLGSDKTGYDAPEDVLILRGELEPRGTEEKAA